MASRDSGAAARLQLGQTFFPQPPRGSAISRHPQIVLTDPALGDAVAVAGLSSEPSPGATRQCVVTPQEYPRLSRPSYLRFEYARISSVKAILEGVAKGLIQLSIVATPELLRRLQTAVLDSKLTKNDVKALLREQGYGAPS